MCNLTIANTALVNIHIGLANKLNQAFAQISNMQMEIEWVKQQKRGETRITTKPTCYSWSHRCTNSASHTSLNCSNKNRDTKMRLYLKRKREEAQIGVSINLDKLCG